MSVPLETRVKAAAATLGFDLVGLAPATLLDAGRLGAWLEGGRHGEMTFLARTAAVRADPGRFLPGATSVVCVAMAYSDAAGREAVPAPRDRVAVARFAVRRDYHEVLRRRLVALGRHLASWVPGARSRVAVDSAPLAEKELARRAGLGFIGRNTLLVNRELGSFLLLGELVTDVPLEPDRPVPDGCAGCTACVDACPTGALSEAGLDARRCIAYLTIEHHSALSSDRAALLGNHVFGCDRCQLVCPFTVGAPTRCDPDLAPRPGLLAPSLGALLGLDPAAWRALTAGTPMRRLDPARLARNLAAVAANLARTERDVTVLSPGRATGRHPRGA